MAVKVPLLAPDVDSEPFGVNCAKDGHILKVFAEVWRAHAIARVLLKVSGGTMSCLLDEGDSALHYYLLNISDQKNWLFRFTTGLRHYKFLFGSDECGDFNN